MKQKNVVFKAILWSAAWMAGAGTVLGKDLSPAAELFYYGSSKGTFETVTEAAQAAYDSYEIRLLRDVDEDIVIGDPDTYGNIPSRKFQLNGKRMKGTLTVYNTTLTFLAPQNEGVTNLCRAGDLKSVVFPKGTSGYLNFEDGNHLDLTQTDLSACGGAIQGYGTNALLRVQQGFEQNLKEFNGIVHVAVDEKHLPFGYEPILVKNPSRMFLYGPDGVELAVDEKRNYVVPGVKVWRAASKDGQADLNDPAGWEGGVVPAAGDRAVVYLDKATTTVSAGTKGTFEVADLRLVMKDQWSRTSERPVGLEGRFTIGAGKGLLVSDVNLTIDPGQVACGSAEIGYACSVTLDGERIVSANLSGMVRVILE